MKKICYLVLALILVLTLAACVSNDATTAAPDPTGNTPHAHSYGEWTTVTAATCATDGLRERVCSCGEKETETIGATGEHSYVDGVCTDCGQTVPNGELQFTRNDDGESYCVSGIGACTDTDIVIPATYHGKPVTAIAREAFRACDHLTSIVIPDSVTVIGYGAFYYCSSLTSVTFGNGLTSIGDYAFHSCTSLTSITIPNRVTNIGEGAFYYCERLESITIPEGVTSIGAWAFYTCRALSSITIPDSVTAIGNDTFRACTNLTSVVLGKGITGIGVGAFSYCSSLTDITLPNAVTSIGQSAFYECESLTNITISDRVTSIGNYAFYGCKILTDIDFHGTKAQWVAIDKGYGWNSHIDHYTIVCSDGEISK